MRENTRCTFSSRWHLCFRLCRPAVQSLTFPGRQHIPFRRQPANISHFHSPAATATRQSPNAFCSFGFPDAKTRGAYFFSIQNHRFRLDRPISPTANPLSIPAIQPPTRQLISFRRHPAAVLPSYFPTLPDRQHIPFRRQPANTSRHPSFHTGPHNP